MPDIRTIVSDLYRQRVRRVTADQVVFANGPMRETTLSPFYRIEMGYRPVDTTLAGGVDNALNLAGKRVEGEGNGYCLYFNEVQSTVSPLTRTHRTVAGGGYSGCLYSVYYIGGGEYRCIHTPRPGGANAEAWVAGIRGYAADQRWQLVHEVPTVSEPGDGGAQVDGCITTYIVTRVSYTVAPNPIVRTVRLRHDAQGRTVRARRWETPTP